MCDTLPNDLAAELTIFYHPNVPDAWNRHPQHGFSLQRKLIPHGSPLAGIGDGKGKSFGIMEVFHGHIHTPAL